MVTGCFVLISIHQNNLQYFFLDKKRKYRVDTNKKSPHYCEDFLRDPAGTRTQGPYIKSVLLYQLSYQISRSSDRIRGAYSVFGSAKIGVDSIATKKKIFSLSTGCLQIH